MAIQFSARSSKKLARALSLQAERANLILAVFSGESLSGYAKEADELSHGLIARRIEQDSFEPKLKKFHVIDSDLSTPGLDKIILVGLGQRSKLTLAGLRGAITVAFEAARDVARSEHLIFPLIDVDLRNLTVEEYAEVVATYACLMDYEVKHQKTRSGEEDQRIHLQSLSLLTSQWSLSAAKRGMRRGQVIGEATCLARDLVNEPSDTLNPAKLASLARGIAADSEGLITCRILQRKAIEKLGMEAFLAVNAGSVDEPVLIDLSYTPPSSATSDLFGIVGKGVTFDTGGVNIKDSSGMKDMKNDMGGAAAVLAVMSTLVKLKPRVPVRAVIAATDNLVDARSFRPGNIVKTMSGLTVQIDHTDAEGRLTLCDALHYIQKKGQVNKIVDLATLTGAIEDALGNYITGVFGNDPKFTKRFLASAQKAGEEMWELPMPEHYRQNNKSSMADLSNDGSGPGAIAAAWFLREFIEEGVSWVHCDIAGTSYRTEEIGVDPEGATGVAVRTIIEHLLEY